MATGEQGRTNGTSPAKVDKNAKDTAQKSATSGNWRQRLRLWSGLVLFAFCLTHFANHALGIISLEAMEAGEDWLGGLWDNPVGGPLLLLAALTHTLLALWRTMRRRTLQMPTWEFVQLVLGLYIPWTLIPHVAATMGLDNAHGVDVEYPLILTLLWPQGAVMQSILLLVVWVHSMVGLHFWLRLYPWYQRSLPFLSVAAILFPLLALWGWIEGARRQALNTAYVPDVTPAQIDWVYAQTDQFRALIFGLIAISLLVVIIRVSTRRFRQTVTVNYPGEVKVRAYPGASLLEISRMNGIPHTAVCGGRARCSTCRVKIIESAGELPAAETAECEVLKRINADESVRLACQLRPNADLTIRPLVPVQQAAVRSRQTADAYYWGVERKVAIMFIDLRNFTGLTEQNLSYDVVYMLNRYLDTVSSAIRQEGGHIDKFIGDGIMAIFGMNVSFETACQQALAACPRIEDAMVGLNKDRGPQFPDPLRIGIGLHGGSAILGRIGSAGTESAHAPITALGDVVNTASRLESENKALGSVLAVSRAVLDAAGVELPQADAAEILLRGKTEPLQILAIRDLDQLSVALSTSTHGLKNTGDKLAGNTLHS